MDSSDNDGVDSISSLPDAILQHILSFIETKFAIRTSLLSKRWRHVWSDTPSLSFSSISSMHDADEINKTLARYTAPKITNFHILTDNVPYIDRWIEFAMSRNADNVKLGIFDPHEYNIPDYFYNNSSVKQLSIDLHHYNMMTPRCSVCWSSLKKLSLRSCRLSDESLANILSGCPVLESLALSSCYSPGVLDLSKSLSLRTLEIDRDMPSTGPKEIVALLEHLHP